MLRDIYNELEKYLDKNLEECISVARMFRDNICNMSQDTLVHSASNFQNIMLDIGGHLESEYGLFDTEGIKVLEQCCELLFKCTTDTNDLRENAMQLIGLLEKLKAVILEGITITSYHTSAVLIAKNEDRYIREWLEFHRLVGISHFYIYDNDSEASFKKILEPYIAQGIVTYIAYPGALMQMNAYNDALRRFKCDTKYMAFIDADEFLVPVDKESVPEAVDYIIDRYNNREFKVDWNPGGIAVNWRWYGGAGHQKMADGLLIENYIYRAEDEYDQNAHIKTICNPRVATGFEGQPHACSYQKGYFNISEKGSYVPGSFFYDSACDHLRINHYHMKSEQEFIEKWHRGWPDIVRNFDSDAKLKSDYASLDEICSVKKDEIMLKYVDKLKAILA